MSPKRSLLLVLSFLLFGGGCESLRNRGRDRIEAHFVREILRQEFDISPDVKLPIVGGRRTVVIDLVNSPFKSLPDPERHAKALDIARAAFRFIPTRESLAYVSVAFVTEKGFFIFKVSDDSDRFTFNPSQLDDPTPQKPAPAPLAAKQEEPPEPDTGPAIDASTVTDKQLCLKASQPASAISNETPEQLLAAMRSALRSVRTIHVRGVEKMEIPRVRSWNFEVHASRESGLSYLAEEIGGSKIRIVQVPGGKTYASGKFFFLTDPVLASAVGDQWIEVPDALLKVNPGDAHPDGPQGVFGMDIGYKAAIASFAQGALSWYPEEQARWFLGQYRKAKAAAQTQAKEMTTVEARHPYFANCRSVQVKSRGNDLQLSASSKPLPFQYDPGSGVMSGYYRWGQYNQPLPKQMPPPGAITLDAIEAQK